MLTTNAALNAFHSETWLSIVRHCLAGSAATQFPWPTVATTLLVDFSTRHPLAGRQFHRLPRKDQSYLEQGTHNRGFQVRQLPPHASPCLYLVLTTKLTSLHVPSIYMLVSVPAPMFSSIPIPVPVFQRCSSPHVHPRHGYSAAYLAPPYERTSLVANICWATEHHTDPSWYPPIQFPHRIHYPALPGLEDSRHRSLARTRVHRSHRPVRLVPQRCV